MGVQKRVERNVIYRCRLAGDAVVVHGVHAVRGDVHIEERGFGVARSVVDLKDTFDGDAAQGEVFGELRVIDVEDWEVGAEPFGEDFHDWRRVAFCLAFGFERRPAPRTPDNSQNLDSGPVNSVRGEEWGVRDYEFPCPWPSAGAAHLGKAREVADSFDYSIVNKDGGSGTGALDVIVDLDPILLSLWQPIQGHPAIPRSLSAEAWRRFSK